MTNSSSSFYCLDFLQFSAHFLKYINVYPQNDLSDDADDQVGVRSPYGQTRYYHQSKYGTTRFH